MIARPLEWEGSWEEILAHSGELTGKRVHLRVVDSSEGGEVSTSQREMLSALDEIASTPLTEAESAAFDDWAARPERYRLSLRLPGCLLPPASCLLRP